ncbi:MAG: MBL fold metallo-hydrolase [Natronomonas sp.]
MRIERIDIECRTRTPGGKTAAYVLGDERCLLVDPAGTTPTLSSRLDDVTDIAVTHHHDDHVGAVEAAAETGATVWCRSGREEAFEAATGVAPDRTFRKGTTIETDTGRVRIVETPGHTPEHVAFAFDDGRRLLVGDLAVLDGSVVVGAPDGDMRAYLTSLRRLRARKPTRLYPAHGPIIDDPEACLRRLLRHRLDRERRVLEAVEDGNRSVAAILEAAYEKDLRGVEDLAGMTVRAHLAKLGHEGRIRWDGARADPVDGRLCSRHPKLWMAGVPE